MARRLWRWQPRSAVGGCWEVGAPQHRRPAINRDPYSILGVPTFATQREISSAYRRLARQFHPDVSGHQDAGERMQDLNWAYGVLRDPASRQAFDRLRVRSGRFRGTAARARSADRWATSPGDGRPTAEAFTLLGGTADRAIVGSMVAVGALAISMLIGLEFVNLGAPIALAVGCWIGSVPNPRLSSQHGLAIGALVGLFSAASFSVTLTDLNPDANLVGRFVCCAPFTVLLGASLGAMVGTLAGWIRQASFLVRSG